MMTMPPPPAPLSSFSSSFSSFSNSSDLGASLRERLRRRYPRDDLIVVLSDSKYTEFALNSREGFRRNNPSAQYLAVGMDPETVAAFQAYEKEAAARARALAPASSSANGVTSAGDDAGDVAECILFSDILGQTPTHSVADSDAKRKDHARIFCTRLDVVSAILEMGYNVFLLDSDVSVTSRFDLSYLPSLNADFVSGHGTFPDYALKRNGFALQGGIYYVRSNPGGKALIAKAAARCRETHDCQMALNDVFCAAYNATIARTRPGNGGTAKDRWNTVVYDAVPKTHNSTPAMRVAILGKEYFPSGCMFVSLASEDAWIRHPICLPPYASDKLTRKKQSLQSMGGWYLLDPYRGSKNGNAGRNTTLSSSSSLYPSRPSAREGEEVAGNESAGSNALADDPERADSILIAQSIPASNTASAAAVNGPASLYVVVILAILFRARLYLRRPNLKGRPGSVALASGIGGKKCIHLVAETRGNKEGFKH